MTKSTKYQHLVFNQEGFILQNDENLFLSKDINQHTAGDLIDFYKNIFPHILDALQHQKVITFKAIQAPGVILPGIYDFIFSLKENIKDPSRPLLECWITERTDFYEDVQQYQQSKRTEAISTFA